jgi:hypothetical protein
MNGRWSEPVGSHYVGKHRGGLVRKEREGEKDLVPFWKQLEAGLEVKFRTSPRDWEE